MYLFSVLTFVARKSHKTTTHLLKLLSGKRGVVPFTPTRGLGGPWTLAFCISRMNNFHPWIQTLNDSTALFSGPEAADRTVCREAELDDAARPVPLGRALQESRGAQSRHWQVSQVLQLWPAHGWPRWEVLIGKPSFLKFSEMCMLDAAKEMKYMTHAPQHGHHCHCVSVMCWQGWSAYSWDVQTTPTLTSNHIHTKEFWHGKFTINKIY